MPAKSDPQAEREGAGSQFYYRKRIRGRDLLPAVGFGIAAGILGFYVAQIYLQRTPLVPVRKRSAADRPARLPIPKRGG
jgi:hypothetical protein